MLLAYAALEATEMVGLWLNKRWAEYLTFIATTVLVPFEVYELTLSVSVFKLVTLVINLAVVHLPPLRQAALRAPRRPAGPSRRAASAPAGGAPSSGPTPRPSPDRSGRRHHLEVALLGGRLA